MTSEPPVAAVGHRRPAATRRLRRILLRPESGAAISALVSFAVFALLAGGNGFLTQLGTADWVDSASELGIVALPVGMLMIAGEFDLSVGAVVGAASITVAIADGYYSVSPWIGIAIAFGVGLLVGLVNGIIVVWTRLPSFIVTLSTLLMVSGGALGVAIALTSSSSVSAVPTGSAKAIFTSSWHSFDVSILWWLGLAALATWVLQKTRFGNWIYATGGSAQTARSVGVPTNRVKVILFVCSSTGAVLVGVIQTLGFSNGNVTLGSDYVFVAIAAAVIGGVLLSGGYGSTLGIAFGSLTYGVVSLGVFFLGWNSDLTQLFIGIFLLLAVLANNWLQQLAVGRR